MAAKMRQEQCVDLFRNLVGSIMADTGQSGELVWRGDERLSLPQPTGQPQ